MKPFRYRFDCERLAGTISAALLLILAAAFSTASLAAEDVSSLPENVALTARVRANSEFSGDYLARFVADGVIPQAGGTSADVGKVWVVQGATHRDGAELVFEWDEPVAVAEIVYYGRTTWFAEECWKDCEVFLDDATEPAATAAFEIGHGPQRIMLAAPDASAPATAKKVLLKFTSSHGGYNPGAAEVRIYSRPTPAKALGKFRRLAAGAVTPNVFANEELLDKPESRQLERDLIEGKLGFDQLVVVQRREVNPSHVYTYHAEGFSPGGGLYVFTPGDGGGELEQLVATPKGQILDCALSYDGQQILFSWKQGGPPANVQLDLGQPNLITAENRPFQIFRINVDGSGLTQLSDGRYNEINPCWLPGGNIAFLSDRKPAFAYCWQTTSPVLYRMNGDGSQVERLSANYLNDFTPSVLNNGRIIYSRWEYVDRPAIPIQSLWTINTDGTGLAGYFGNRILSPATFMEARPIPGGNKIICVMTSHSGPCRGAIGIIDRTLGDNAQAAIRNLTPEVNIGRVDQGDGNAVRGPYESPYPIDEELFLVSRQGHILLRDYDGTKTAAVLAPRDGIGFYSAQPILARPTPPARPSALPERLEGKDEEWATVFLQDVYNGLEPHVKRGEIKQLCVVQELEKSQWASPNNRVFGFQFPVVSCGATYAPKKVWGFVPVAEDGSAHFKVPACVPIYFMALDAQGRAVQRMRTFTHLMPGEQQGCVGCHEPRHHTSRNRARPTAVSGPPRELEPPEWGRVGFSYSRIVQPVLDLHCVKCHNAHDAPNGVDLGGDMTDFFNVSYEVLARQGTVAANSEVGRVGPGGEGASPYTSWIATYNGAEHNILKIAPRQWGSPASKLGDLLVSGHPDKDGLPRVKLSAKSRQRLMTWMDLNVPYYGASASNHPNRRGCRQMMPAQLEQVLQRVASERCASCHESGIPRRHWVRVSNPRLNSFLLAPLARAAGGTQACGQAVFANTDDADYQAILKVFEPLHQLLEQTPRIDMSAAD